MQTLRECGVRVTTGTGKNSDSFGVQCSCLATDSGDQRPKHNQAPFSHHNITQLATVSYHRITQQSNRRWQTSSQCITHGEYLLSLSKIWLESMQYFWLLCSLLRNIRDASWDHYVKQCHPQNCMHITYRYVVREGSINNLLTQLTTKSQDEEWLTSMQRLQTAQWEQRGGR